MSERIVRTEIVQREVEVPADHEVCSWCKGKGRTSKYDEGWRSIAYDADLAAPRECFHCRGRGYVHSAVSVGGLGHGTAGAEQEDLGGLGFAESCEKGEKA